GLLRGQLLDLVRNEAAVGRAEGARHRLPERAVERFAVPLARGRWSSGLGRLDDPRWLFLRRDLDLIALRGPGFVIFAVRKHGEPHRQRQGDRGEMPVHATRYG